MSNSGKKYVRDAELANRFSVSRPTIWRWVRQGFLPRPIKIAGSTRFDLEACDLAFNQGGAQNAA